MKLKIIHKDGTLLCGCYKIDGMIFYCDWHNYHRDELYIE